MAATNKIDFETALTSPLGGLVLDNLIEKVVSSLCTRFSEPAEITAIRFSIDFNVNHYCTVVQMHVLLEDTNIVTVWSTVDGDLCWK